MGNTESVTNACRIHQNEAGRTWLMYALLDHHILSAMFHNKRNYVIEITRMDVNDFQRFLSIYCLGAYSH